MWLHTDLLWPTLALAFVWGSLWGSFLNVVIWRLPRGKSLIHPPSHCPHCGAGVRWFDNIPIFAWLWLRGKCRDCEAPISGRYPLVELVAALLTAALWWHVAAHRIDLVPVQTLLVPFLFWQFFVLVCLAIALIDLDLTIIPHELTFPTMAAGLAAALLIPKTGTFETLYPQVDIVDSVLGLVLGAGSLIAVFQGYKALTGRVGMGGGDVTMIGMIGAYLGWQSLVFVLLFSSLQGVLVAVGAGVYRKIRPEKGTLLIEGAHKASFWESDPVAEEEARRLAERTRAAGGAPPEGVDSAKATPESPSEVAPADALAESDAATLEGGEGGEEDAFLQLAIPFGPFLALAAVQYIFVGATFWRWLMAGDVP